MDVGKIGDSPKIDETKLIEHVVFIFVLPVALLYFNIINKDFRVLVLAVACLLIYGIITQAHWSRKDMAMVVGDRKSHLIPYAIFILVGSATIVLLAHLFGLEAQASWWNSKEFWSNPHFLFLFIFVSYLQEFAYRVFLIRELERTFSKVSTIIIINASLFIFLHAIYPITWPSVILVIISAFAFPIMYMRYRDFWLIGFAHSVFNFIAVLHGFLVIQS